MDPHMTYVLWAAAYAVSSHVMARSTLSRGTGRSEEILTADLADILTLFNPYREYFVQKGSRSQVTISIVDFNKRVEKRVGADFAILLRGRVAAHTGATDLRKAILVQAKRQDAATLAYAASGNHVAKATTMINVAGHNDAFFAFYHRDDVLTLPHTPSTQRVPKFAFASPLRKGNQQFFIHEELGSNVPETFSEPSFYRRYILGRNRTFDLPAGYEWGVGLLPATYFVDNAGTIQHSALPPIAHVLQHGTSFPDFLSNLALCAQGTNRPSDSDLIRLLGALDNDALGEGDGAFAPSFAVVVQFDDTGGDRNNITEFGARLHEFEGLRVLEEDATQ